MSVFSSKSFILRSVRKSDFEAVFSWENDEKNWIQSGICQPYKIEEIELYVSKSENLRKDGQTRYIVELTNGTVIGCVDLFDYNKAQKMASIGLLIMEEYRKKGYGSRVLSYLDKIAKKEHELKILKALVLANNIISVQLFKKNGFLPDDTKATIYTYKNVNYLQLTYFKNI